MERRTPHPERAVTFGTSKAKSRQGVAHESARSLASAAHARRWPSWPAGQRSAALFEKLVSGAITFAGEVPPNNRDAARAFLALPPGVATAPRAAR